jgi:hypothetical protein
LVQKVASIPHRRTFLVRKIVSIPHGRTFSIRKIVSISHRRSFSIRKVVSISHRQTFSIRKIHSTECDNASRVPLNGYISSEISHALSIPARHVRGSRAQLLSLEMGQFWATLRDMNRFFGEIPTAVPRSPDVEALDKQRIAFVFATGETRAVELELCPIPGSPQVAVSAKLENVSENPRECLLQYLTLEGIRRIRPDVSAFIVGARLSLNLAA